MMALARARSMGPGGRRTDGARQRNDSTRTHENATSRRLSAEASADIRQEKSRHSRSLMKTVRSAVVANWGVPFRVHFDLFFKRNGSGADRRVCRPATGKSVRVPWDRGRASKAARRREKPAAEFRWRRATSQRSRWPWLDFDVGPSSPRRIKMVSLGRASTRCSVPRGSHAEPPVGTVTFSTLGNACAETKAGRSRFPRRQARATCTPLKSARSRSAGPKPLETIFHPPSWIRIIRSKPACAKGVYVRTSSVSSTMAPPD